MRMSMRLRRSKRKNNKSEMKEGRDWVFFPAFIAGFLLNFLLCNFNTLKILFFRKGKQTSTQKSEQQQWQRQHKCHVMFYSSTKISRKCVTSFLLLLFETNQIGCMQCAIKVHMCCFHFVAWKLWNISLARTDRQGNTHKNFGRIVLLPFIIEMFSGKSQMSNKHTTITAKTRKKLIVL